MSYNNILINVAKLLILFSIIYFLWLVVVSDALRDELSSMPFVGSLFGRQPTHTWLANFNQTYYNALQRTIAKINDSVINGKQFYLQDVNASIAVASNGTVYVNTSAYTNNSDVMLIYFYNRIAWRYMCINSLFAGRQICNSTYSNLSQQYLESVRKSMSFDMQSQEAEGATFIIPTDINNHGGVLDSFSYRFTPSDDYLYTLLGTNPDELYNIGNDYEKAYAVVDFSETSTKCLHFAIPRFSRVRVNVTMPGPIIRYTIPSLFLNQSIMGTDSVYVDYNPYPCCGIPKSHMIEVEMCS